MRWTALGVTMLLACGNTLSFYQPILGVDGGCDTAIQPAAAEPGDLPNVVRLSVTYSPCDWGNGITLTGQSAQIVTLRPANDGSSDIDGLTVYSFGTGVKMFTHFTGTGTAYTFNDSHTVFTTTFTGTEVVDGGTVTYNGANGSIAVSGTSSGDIHTYVGTGSVTQQGAVPY